MLQKLEILSFKNVLNLILVPQGFVHMRYFFFSEYKGNTHTRELPLGLKRAAAQSPRSASSSCTPEKSQWGSEGADLEQSRNHSFTDESSEAEKE